MKLSLIQTSLVWENQEANREQLGVLIDSIKEATDLIVLPEMFTTGFTMKPELFAEAIESSKTLTWLKEKAQQKNCVITGSASIKEENNYYNRLFWVQPTGNIHTYDKRHLFRVGQEHLHYTAGTKRLITQIKEWTICPQVCYDLRFPVWSRNRFTENKDNGVSAEYDVLLYIANWPEVRSYPWKHLLIARAIENQCYVIGLNRVGVDGNGIGHSGDSIIVNPRGEVIHALPLNERCVYTTTLDKQYLLDFRKAFPVGLDADNIENLF
jgi:omega-amidase